MAPFKGYSDYPGTRYDWCVMLAHELLKKSADSWAEGDPEDPPTEEVLKQILKIFEEPRFLKRPW